MRINISKDKQFKVSREVLKSKRRELRKNGKGNNLSATVVLTNVDIERIFDKNLCGIHDLEGLSRTMRFLLTLHFGHRARHEERQMKFGDIVLKKRLKLMAKSTWHGQPRGRAGLTTAMKQVTGNVQCPASKNLFTGDRKRPNH